MRRTTLFFLLPFLGALPAIAQSVPAYAIPNSKHYRESGVGNAHGRSGSAQLTTRALLAKDGSSTVEVTTGALDSPDTPPGSLAKVQFKPLDPDGNAMFAQNFASSGTGHYTFNWPSLYRHQQVQIQGNIRGIDPRTDVVSVIETVKFRPDLAIKNFKVPTSAFVNAPVIIPANVVELNGDSSATTTCQLSIDGTVVDHASNVYVDAGGSVSCAFSYTFTTTGNHTVQVAATNVVPADWDTANNLASDSISITDVNTNTAESGSANFSDQQGGFPSAKTSIYQTWLGGNLVSNYNNTTSSTGRQQSTGSTFSSGNCVGQTDAVPFQFPVDVTYTESMDGKQVYSGQITGITGFTRTRTVNSVMCNDTAVRMVQLTGSGVGDNFNVTMFSRAFYNTGGTLIHTDQQVDTTRNAGDVTYISSQFQCDFYNDCNNPPTNYHYWNSSTESIFGTQVPLGNTWTPSVTTTDAGGNGFGGSLSVPLFSNQINFTTPDPCIDNGPDSSGYSYHICNSTTDSYTLTQGSASY